MSEAYPETVAAVDTDVQIVLGPPGTGKTTYLMGRLEDELGAGTNPDDIAFISFTRAAVGEARSRACTRFGLEPDAFPFFRTIHSMAFRLGRKHGQLMGKKDWTEFCEMYHYGLSDVDTADEDDPQAMPTVTKDDRLRGAMEWARVRLVSIAEGLRTFPDPPPLRDVQEYASRYKSFKAAKERFDFTDMLERCLADGARPGCPVVFIDEAQDLYPLQIALVENWTDGTARVYVAGDDDQAIYAWAGAEPDWLIALSQKFRVVHLTQSHRVPRAPHALAQDIIARNRNRVAKTYAPKVGAVGAVEYLRTVDALARIDQSRSTFLLFRNIRALRDVAQRLFTARVRYVSERGGKNPLGRPALLGALRTLAALRDGRAVTFSDMLALDTFVPAEPFFLRGAKAEIKRRAKDTPGDICAWPLAELRAAVVAHGPTFPLVNGGVDVATREYLTSLLGDGTEIPAPTVTLTTIHAAKGREADHVLVFSDHSRLTHDAMVQNRNGEREGENRVAYVAVTRTRDLLTIVLPETRFFYPYPTVRPA